MSRGRPSGLGSASGTGSLGGLGALGAAGGSLPDAAEFLAERAAKGGPLATHWATLDDLYNKKLWHQLTLKLEAFVRLPELQEGEQLVDIYNFFISTFETKINPLSLIEIAAYVVRQIKKKKEAISFLEKFEPKVKNNGEALALCKVLQGQIYLQDLKNMESTKKIIEELENTLEDADGVTTVHGRYYHLAAEYYRLEGSHALYYRAALRQLGCAGDDLGTPEQRAQQAFFLSLAALLGDDIYNLGELLSHPIVESLNQTENAWLVEVVRAVDRGDVVAFENLRPRWSQVSDLAAHEIRLRQKISLLRLMEMSSNGLSAKRTFSFQEIADKTRLHEDDVEPLVMKALAHKLIKGSIDQVSKEIRIQWVRPRAEERDSILALAYNIDHWRLNVSNAIRTLENMGKEIIADA